MLSPADIERYNRDGFIVVPNVFSAAEVAAMQRATDEIIGKASSVTDHNDVYDLEPGHTPQMPRVRRIKTPDKWHPAFSAAVRHPNVIACLKSLWGPNIRFDLSKLNMKSAGYGSPVEWHQDWAFYPHTNDDLAAVGVMIDDVDMDNGPMLVVPGSHKGPVYDHHAQGRFCGAIDPVTSKLDVSTAKPVIGKAGSISVHHVRAIHGSAPNNSNRGRRFFLLQFRSADAWPLIQVPTNWESWSNLLVAGEETLHPRVTPVPVRLPFPPATNPGSIYENQRELEHRFFNDANGTRRAAT
jgi:ectoine hydroxylase-related dioxygenase (phytanoyl-CoA dioxygenase family)